MAVPDVPLLAADLKSRIIPWAKTNLGIVSRFYEDGQWHIGDENTAWYLSPCFAALAATMYRWDPSLKSYRDIAVETVEAGFTWNLKADNALAAPTYTYLTPESNALFTGFSGAASITTNFDGGPWGTPDAYGDGDESSTMEAGSTFCWILDMLWSSPEHGGLSTATALRWLANLKKCCDWLIDKDGLVIWYTNGNYTAHQCLLYTHVSRMCRVLGDEAGWARYRQAYELCLGTLIYPYGNHSPANAQWSGYGYQVGVAGPGSTVGTNGKGAVSLAAGTTSDASTETGWLSETPGYTGLNPAATFDGVYSQLQMDILATIFVINRDWRINYLMNAIWNKLEPITNFTTFLIDCTGGSRQTGVRGWTGGYQNVISLLGRRTNNRTNITNAMCTGVWDNQLAANLTANGNNLISLIQSSTSRQYRVAVATSLQACYLTDKKL